MADLTNAGFVPPSTAQSPQAAHAVGQLQKENPTRQTRPAGDAGKQADDKEQKEESSGGGKLSLLSRIAFRDGQMVIQVIDRVTQNVVREFPSEALGEIQQQLEVTLGATVDAQV